MMKTTTWSTKEKQAWMPPSLLTVSEWADRYRILTPLTSAEPGKWRTERTPYLKGIMDTFNNPFVEEITIMASTQVGKTESILNILAYIIDQDAGPVLLVYPRIDDAKSMSQNRIKPMLESSPELAQHLPRNYDEFKLLEYRLDKMNVYFAGSNSPADLASKPIRYLLLDEIDKYPRFSGKEADPIKLATERTRTFWNRKIVKVSTPTTHDGYIYREYKKARQLRYYVPCPYCSKYQFLIFTQIKWPQEERDHEKISSLKLAYYECRKCGKQIDDQQKQQIIRKGVWAQEESEILQDGTVKNTDLFVKHVGFWINALYSPWLTFSDIVSEFLKSKNYTELLMNFVNSWLAEIWQEKSEETRPDRLRKLCGNYIEGVVPDGVVTLTAGVDVQKDHFYIVIRGWGYNEESWLIRACRVESWNAVEDVILRTHYKKEHADEVMAVRLACIDSQYRTDEVHDFCRTHRDICRAVQGKDFLPGNNPYQFSRIDRKPDKKPLRRGLVLYRINLMFFKNKINRMVHADRGDPAQWHLFKDINDDYLIQFCAEAKFIEVNKKTGTTSQIWKLKHAGAPNHYWDCEVYCVSAAYMAEVHLLRDNGIHIYTPQHERKLESFINVKEDWINDW